MSSTTEEQSVVKQIEEALNLGVPRDVLVGMGFNKNSVRTVASLIKHGRTKLSKVNASSLDPDLLDSILKKKIESELNGDERIIHKEFVLESHMKSVLSKDLSIVEEHLELIGVEYALPSGKRIDILAKEKNGRHVVIELKKSHSEYMAVGQLLYYMGKLDEMFSTPGNCRGIIIASEITDELIVACKNLKNIKLIQYSTSISLSEIGVSPI